MTKKKKRAFITGGASGLGRSLAFRYARAGWRVCIGDIQQARGEETRDALRKLGAEAEFLLCDVTSESDLSIVAEWLEQKWGGVDLVVNNAGVVVAGRIDDVPLSDWQWIVDVNLLGVVRGCRTFAPILRRQGAGHIVNIASLAGHVHPPGMGPYNAVKAAVVALSETLYIELASAGINVSVVCPAFFRTDLMSTARLSDRATKKLAYNLVLQARHGADEIADVVYRGIESGRFNILTDVEGRAFFRLKRLLPFKVYATLLARTNRRLRTMTSTST